MAIFSFLRMNFPLCICEENWHHTIQGALWLARFVSCSLNALHRNKHRKSEISWPCRDNNFQIRLIKKYKIRIPWHVYPPIKRYRPLLQATFFIFLTNWLLSLKSNWCLQHPKDEILLEIFQSIFNLTPFRILFVMYSLCCIARLYLLRSCTTQSWK